MGLGGNSWPTVIGWEDCFCGGGSCGVAGRNCGVNCCDAGFHHAYPNFHLCQGDLCPKKHIGNGQPFGNGCGSAYYYGGCNGTALIAYLFDCGPDPNLVANDNICGTGPHGVDACLTRAGFQALCGTCNPVITGTMKATIQ